MQHQNPIQDCMYHLASIYQYPVLVMDSTTKKVTVLSYFWTSPEAKELYDKLVEMLTDMKVKELASMGLTYLK